MNRACKGIPLTLARAVACGLLLASVAHAQKSLYTVTESPDEIRISTPQLEAAVRKRGYVSGVGRGSFVDKKTGFHDPGYGLDIIDWIMEPGSDEAYRDQLEGDLAYHFGNPYHGSRAKRSIEGPQICTQAKELSPEVIRGKDFVAVRQHPARESVRSGLSCWCFQWESATSSPWTKSTR